MAAMARYKDVDWGFPEGQIGTWEQAAVAVLMDIRDRLDVLRCPDFVDIPYKLDAIKRQTRRQRPARVDPFARHRAASRRRRRRG